MRKMIRPAALLLVLAVLAGALSGCTLGERKQLTEKAEKYVAALQRNKNVSDTFTLSKERVSIPDKALSIPFSVRSETYGENFTVWVDRGEDGQVTDTYYSLYLRQDAEDKMNAVIAEVLGSNMAHANVSFLPADHPAVSGHAAGSTEELIRLAQEAGIGIILDVSIVNPEQLNPEEADVDRLLLALQEKGCYCKLYPYVSDAVSFEVMKDGFWKTTRTGADGGAYMNRTEYTPGSH